MNSSRPIARTLSFWATLVRSTPGPRNGCRKMAHITPASLAQANQGGNVQAVGRILFTRYVFQFEIAGLLLVVAAVGALVLGRRRP